MILNLSEFRVVALAKFAKESKKTCDFVDIEYQKLISHSVTRWLSFYGSLPRMLQMYPASHSYLCPSASQLLFWNVIFLEILWANTVQGIRTFAIISGCFHWTSSEYWAVQSITC